MSFKYAKHDDIEETLYLKVNKLLDPNRILGIYDKPESSGAALVITVKLFSGKNLLFATTKGIFKIPNDAQTLCCFSLPMSIQDLPSDSVLYIYVWSTSRKPTQIPAASTTLPIFTSEFEKFPLKSGCLSLRQGTYQLSLWPEKSADQVYTPGIVDNPQLSELYSLCYKKEKFELGMIEKIKWIDEKTIPSMEKRIEEICEEANLCLLEVELPRFYTSVFFEENKYEVEQEALFAESNLTIVPDFEVIYERIDPKAELYLTLSRSDLSHKELRPTGEVIDQINEILNLPDHKALVPEQSYLIWLYRYSLLGNKHALVKFLHSVNWGNEKEEEIAVQMMREWSPIDKEDSLNLLSVNFSCNTHYSTLVTKGIAEVRKYAVERLDTCSDLDLSSILLQLVQAIRYENTEDSPLKDLLLRRALDCTEIAIYLFWYLNVESKNPSSSVTDWYRRVFESTFNFIAEKAPETMKYIEAQVTLKLKLLEISNTIRKNKGDTSSFDKKKAKLKQLVEEIKDFKEPVPSFFEHNTVLTGILPPECNVYASKQYPIKVVFKTPDPSVTVAAMYKSGDDLRQDQLIIQIIRLMDNLLKNVNLDMCLTLYNVVATSNSDGFVEFVPNSSTIHDRIQKKQLLSAYLNDNKANNPEIFETFIKSCAGYCVITYLLGIGDRHLENLMIDNTGHLFHIDFGYVLGKDPKPMPPPFKLCKEMVEAMGGERSPGYERFKLKCVEVFMHLRKHCKLIVNLFYLMIHSGLSGMQGDPLKIIDKLYERFKIGLSDEKAERYFLELITESVNALMPQILEKIHVWAIYWKKI